jgi:hypothetical protein
MPQIIVTAGDRADLTDGTLTLRERINTSDFESDRFATNLLERLRWAVSDANEVESRDEAWSPEAKEREDAGELVEV